MNAIDVGVVAIRMSAVIDKINELVRAENNQRLAKGMGPISYFWSYATNASLAREVGPPNYHVIWRVVYGPSIISSNEGERTLVAETVFFGPISIIEREAGLGNIR